MTSYHVATLWLCCVDVPLVCTCIDWLIIMNYCDITYSELPQGSYQHHWKSSRPTALYNHCTTPRVSKRSLLMSDNNYGNCGPIFKIFSPIDSYEMRESMHVCWQFISTYICQFLYIYLNILSNVINFSTNTHCFHPVKFWVGLFIQKMKMQFFGNDVIFSSSRVSVSDNCKQSITVWFLLTLF